MGISPAMKEALCGDRRTTMPMPTRAFLIPSPAEDKRIADARNCTQGVRAEAMAAAIACVVSAVPMLTVCRVVPWAKANLNYTAQALIISAASIAAYFITTDKTILEFARRNAHCDKTT